MKPSLEKKLGKVTYNKQVIELSGGTTPTGTLEITENGTYDVTEYAEANVNVPSSGITPSGGLTINLNGTYNVTNYESAKVDVAPYSDLMYLESKGLRFNVDNYSEDLIIELDENGMGEFPFEMHTDNGVLIYDSYYLSEYVSNGYVWDIYITRIIIRDINLLNYLSNTYTFFRFFSMFEYPVYFNGELMSNQTALINKLKRLEEGVEYHFDIGQLISLPNAITKPALYGTNTRLRKIYHYGTSSGGVGQSFMYNKFIERVDFDARVKSITNYAYRGCTGLKTIVCLGQTPPIMQSVAVFSEVVDATLYVPIGCIDTYMNATNWSSVVASNNWTVLELDENNEIPTV